MEGFLQMILQDLMKKRNNILQTYTVENGMHVKSVKVTSIWSIYYNTEVYTVDVYM